MNNRERIFELAQSAQSFNQKGQYFEAKKTYIALLKLIPNDLSLLNALGLLSMHLEDHQDAILFFCKSLKINLNQPNILFNQAISYKRNKEYDLAIESYKKAIKYKPDFFEAHFNLANLLKDINQFHEALINYEAATKINPIFIDTYNNWASVLVELFEFEKANKIFQQALQILPQDKKLLLNYARNLKNLEKFIEAQEVYNSLEETYSKDPEIIFSKGSLMLECGHLNEAIICFNDAIQMKPDYVEAYINKATALSYLNQFDEAIKNLEQALQMKPDHADAFFNKGMIFFDIKNYEEAINNFDNAIQIDKNHADSHFNKAELYLSNGRYEEGWKMYEWRWKTASRLKDKNNIQQLIPLSLEDLLQPNKSILIQSEVGFGDYIMFIRFIEKLKISNLKVIIETPKELESLFINSFSDFASVVSVNNSSQGADFILPIMSLPRLFKTDIKSIPNKFPYLKIDPLVNQKWKSKIKPSKKLKIGIIWSGKKRNIDRSCLRNRTIGLNYILPILDLPFEFYCLSNKLDQEDNKFFLENNYDNFFQFNIENFSDTAAIIDHMDLVISIDTSVAHLAGALGKRLWIILPYKSDYRWADGERTPWYPSAKIFRKSINKDWDEPINLVINELKKI